MFSWIIQATIVSIIFILLVHHLIQLLKDTLTYPKTKDLVNVPSKKYEDIYHVLNQSRASSDTTSIHTLDNISMSREKLLPDFEPSPSVVDDESAMKNELKNFIKRQQQQPPAPASNSSHIPQSYA
jgi:hypothetical protein